MTKQELSKKIAEQLFDSDCLNQYDFSGDVTALLRVTEETIEYNLKDFLILSGAEIVVG